MDSELRFKLRDSFYSIVRILGKYIKRGFKSGMLLLEFNIIELEVSERRISLIVL